MSFRNRRAARNVDYIERQVLEYLERLRMNAEREMREYERAKEAWENSDFDYLEREGILNEDEIEALMDADI